jgi:hypothetical protein
MALGALRLPHALRVYLSRDGAALGEGAMIQLSLFPVRGFALLLGYPWHELAIDNSGGPKVWRTRRAARRAYERQPSYMRLASSVVPVECHEPAPGGNGLPTFLIRS